MTGATRKTAAGRTAAPRRRRANRPRILLLQGANMTYLGKRQPELYGTTTRAELDSLLAAHARARGVDIDIVYTHVEGEAVARIYGALDAGLDALVMNPAGFLYAGFALRDCLRAIPVPIVEVHMTNIEKRGVRTITAEAATGYIAGFGIDSYILGLDAALGLLARAKP